MEKETLSWSSEVLKTPLWKLDVELGKYIFTRGHARWGKTHPRQEKKKDIEFHGIRPGGLVPREWKEESERAIVLQKGINTREPKWRGVHCEKGYNDEGQESALRWEVNSWGANWELRCSGWDERDKSISQQDRSSDPVCCSTGIKNINVVLTGGRWSSQN